MAALFRIPPAIHSSVVLGLNACLFAFGIVLLILAPTVRHNLTAYKLRQFPIYPEGRPSHGSTNAPYFPTHLSASDNAAQIALGGVAALYGGVSTVLLYLQCTRPRTEIRSPLDKIVGWVAMMVAGGATTLTAAVATGLSFGGNDEGGAIDLRSVGYWPWKNMFPTIHWSIEGWTCKVSHQLDLPQNTDPAADFAQMCEYTRISKWLTLVLLLLGMGAMALAASVLVELRRLERGEVADARVDALRDSEKGGKEP